MRKIVQISAIPETKERKQAAIALCDDGTVWETWITGSEWAMWQKLPDIPQEDGHQ